MRIHRGLEELPKRRPRTAVTIGNFDAVHRGHRALIERLIGVGDSLDADPTLVTFDPHPRSVLGGEAPCALTTPEQKMALLEQGGLSRVVVLTFDRALSLVEPEVFVRTILLQELKASAVVVGSSFRFGHRAGGDVTLLRRVARESGTEVVSVRLRKVGGRSISSTAIRTALSEGEVEWAGLALGRPYSLEGTVVRGHRRGADLGFPTANLEVPQGVCLPRAGIYAGYVDIGGPDLPAAISIGTNPQFGRNPLTVEAFILDFDGELYGRRARVSLVSYLREEKRFRSPQHLVAAMTEDVRKAREVLGVPTGAK